MVTATNRKKCTLTSGQWAAKVQRDAKKIERRQQDCAALEAQIRAKESSPDTNLDTHQKLYKTVRDANNATATDLNEQAALAQEMRSVQIDNTLPAEEKCTRLETLANKLYRGAPGKYKGIKDPSASTKCRGDKVATVQPWVRSTSTTTLNEINSELGTKVDFSKLSGFEGGQWLQPYVPCSKGTVAGNSGVTVCTGCDLGQKSEAELKALGLSDATFEKIKKYADERYKGYACADANKALDETGRVTLEPDECDAIDKAVKNEHLLSARDEWNERMPPGGTKFEQLTTNQQTVIFSRTYQQGKGMPDSDVAQDFYEAAQSGDWAKAKQKLQDYDVKADWYKKRVKSEADLL